MEVEIQSGDRFSLAEALLVYRHGSEAVILRHQVSEGKILPGGEQVDVKAFLSGITTGKVKTNQGGVEWTDPRIIATGPGWVCWWRASALTTIFCNGKPYKVKLPPLLFIMGRLRRVWILPANKRPTQDTKLYLTHWPNTYTNGGICWGNGRIPETLDPLDWEDAFFSSSFEQKLKLNHAKNKNQKAFGTLRDSLEALRGSAN